MKYLVAELIQQKRDGHVLTREELSFLVKGFANGEIPDYQVAAWLMATFFRGLNAEETLTLTREMKDSGQSMKWRELDPSFGKLQFADKHSTGGVGDKVSLILAPVAACLGLRVPMMSGPGLGFTGGTVDKLLSIPGFRMKLPKEEMLACLHGTGVCMMSQSEVLCPADRKLYALRDVTATVESLPLITASIVSKKWAAGVENIVYDIKCGSAAFMTDFAKAKALGESLVHVSKLAGMKAVALVTRMEEPLGAFIGNALEVREATFILKNEFPESFHEYLAIPLTQLSCRLAAEMAVLAGVFNNIETAYEAALEIIRHGHAWEVFQKMVIAQGGQPDWQETLATSVVQVPYRAPKSGYLRAIRSRELGLAGIKLGAGREKATDVIDPSTGFELFLGVGQKVEKGQILCLAHLKRQSQFEDIHSNLEAAFDIQPTASAAPSDLVLETIT